MSDQSGASPHAETEARIAALTGEDKTAFEGAPESGTSTEPRTPEPPDYFGDKFDPATLEDKPELLAAYKLMQGQFTKRNQELADQRKTIEGDQAFLNDLRSDDPEARQNAMVFAAQQGWLTPEQTAEVFGWEIDQQQDEDALLEDDPVAARIAALEAKLTQREQADVQAAEQAQQQQWIAQADTHIGETITSIEKEIGRDLSEREQSLLVRSALASPYSPEGFPDVRAVFEDYSGALTDFQKGWREGKTHAQPSAQGGVEATQKVNLDNERERQDYIAERLSQIRDPSAS